MLRRTCRILKGDLASVVLHDCNPQHGAPYNNHDRAMRDEEFHAFLASVKGWTTLDSGAIHRSYDFDNYKLAYEWMGRVFAFAYISDKYPKLHWKDCHVEVTLYSGRFHGISRREARLAAFMNDHFNLLRKAQVSQREQLEATSKLNPFVAEPEQPLGKAGKRWKGDAATTPASVAAQQPASNAGCIRADVSASPRPSPTSDHSQASA